MRPVSYREDDRTAMRLVEEAKERLDVLGLKLEVHTFSPGKPAPEGTLYIESDDVGTVKEVLRLLGVPHILRLTQEDLNSPVAPWVGPYGEVEYLFVPKIEGS